MVKAAPRQYSMFGFNSFSSLVKAKKPEPSNDKPISSESVIVDEEAQRDFDWELKYLKLPLRILGIWPLDDQSSHLRWLVIFVFGLMYAIPVIIGLAFVGTSRLADHQIEYFADVSLITYGSAQLILFKMKRSNVRSILLSILENWKRSTTLSAEDKKSMFIYGGKTRMIIALCMASYFITTVVYFTEPLIGGEEVSMKKLPTYGIYPFSTDCSPNYQIVSAMQLVQASIGVVSVISIDGYLVLSVLHGCGQLDMLCKTIYRYEGKTSHPQSLGNGGINKNISNHCPCLKCIVDRHVSLSEYIEMIDDTFSGIIMARLMMNTVNFCAVGYGIVQSNETGNVVDFARHILYMLTMISNLFMYCWTGEQLLKKSEKVSRTVYELRWYSIDARVARSLVLIMLRSKKPMKITAGKFFIMTLVCYQKWFMNALGYLSVIVAIKSHS